uniref:Chorismate lyase n=1 Tax=Paulinella micropora TaxID=1928728 RepID=A0A1L5YBS3_9EUKA|nr:hypothetical protein PMNZ_371 [Paulinella micropora]APP88156.1 hypothetical protein PCKR_369 [Paulinella micropora]AQX44923.1 hypothetical protein PFK_369 [Paulinella micropora]AXY63315.1 hypothetical protein PMNZ_371 [Paulinella micropora]
MLYSSPHVLWQAPFQQIVQGHKNEDLNGPWRLILLGDGSLTRHLQLLTGQPVQIELIGMEHQEVAGAKDPLEVSELAVPLIKRQVWLCCCGQKLAWAESWWNREQAAQNLLDKSLPIWRSLTIKRAELFREVDGLALVNESWLEQSFDCTGPFWSRHYRFFRNSKELTVIREVFSPALEMWLGASTNTKNLE